MNGCSDAAEASGRTAIRHRPYPLGSRTSIATATSDFLPFWRPPRSPGSSPPMKVSSTSTRPLSSSRPGLTSTERSRCSIAHAVWYELISSARCRLCAETPSFWVANSQHAMNQTVRGVRVLSKIVPAVTDVAERHEPQRSRPSPRRHPPGSPAGRAHEPVGPAEPLQVVQAVIVGTEPRPHLAHRSRVVTACHRPALTAQPYSTEVRLSGYPYPAQQPPNWGLQTS